MKNNNPVNVSFSGKATLNSKDMAGIIAALSEMGFIKFTLGCLTILGVTALIGMTIVMCVHGIPTIG